MKQFRFYGMRTWCLLISLVLTLSAYAQEIIVTGQVKDVSGEPIIGANILVKETATGTITDFDGHYSVKAEKGRTLVFKYVGYKTQEIVVNQSTINVTMHEDAVLVEDVVVVGYATGSERTISGAVQKVGKEDMNSGIVSSPLQALKGKVAGVNIQKTGGDPTSTPSIRVRGTTSLTGGNDPLVIIDGVFGDLAMLNAIAPSDIETFTILKDASETAQYGSRGASGVIVVTTQKGQNGVSSISYDGTYGVETVYDNLDMLSASEFRAMKTKGYPNLLDFDPDANTNFIEEMQRTGFTQNHRLSFSNGNQTGNYRASIGMIDQTGIIKNNSMQNYTAKLDAMQYKFNNKLKLEFGMFASLKKNKYVNDYEKTFYSAASYNPTFPTHRNPTTDLWDENPNANEVQNPLGRLDINDKETNAYVNVHGKATYTIIEGLKFSVFGSYTYNVKENMTYIPFDIKAGQGNQGEANRHDNKASSMMANAMLSYTKDFGKHHIDALGLAEIQKYDYTGFNAGAQGFTTNAFQYYNLGAGGTVKYGSVGSYANDNKLASFMGRFNYVYNDRYIATVNLRADGSSKFGKNNRWAYFPSASLAWNMTKEDFLKDVSWLDKLKVRAGYGLAGNQDAIDSYTSMALLAPSGVTSVNGISTVTMAQQRNANPDLKWEVKTTVDVGVDAAFLNNRITLGADWYYSETNDLLYNYSVPVPPFTYNTLLANLGSMSNTGVEITMGFTPLKTKDMELNINLNAAWQKNKLLSLNGTYGGEDLTTTQYMVLGGVSGAGSIGGKNDVLYQMVGKPIGVFYLPKCTGLVDNGFGEYSYNVVDINHDGKVNIADGEDRYVAGQAMPKVLAGANISFRYKDFDIAVQMNGAFGHKIYNGTSRSYMNMEQFPTYNVLASAPTRNIHDSTVTDYWLEDGDYVHIDYVTLGWNVPTENWGCVNNLRLTFSVNNLATFTNYSGLSPMINSTTVGGDLGIDDRRFYPLSRTYSLGLSVNF